MNRCGIVLVALLAGCASVRETADQHGFGWKAPPAGAPGDHTRFGDQSDPRLERLDVQSGVAADPLSEAAVLSRHAAAQRAEGDVPEALASYRRALQLRERAAEQDASPATQGAIAATLTSIAALEVQLGASAAAEAALRRALAIRTAAFGDGDVRTGQSASNLALLLAAEGRYDEAEPLYQQAIRALEQPPGAHDGDLATVLDNYAALLADAGRADDAAATSARAAVLRATGAGPDAAAAAP